VGVKGDAATVAWILHRIPRAIEGEMGVRIGEPRTAAEPEGLAEAAEIAVAVLERD
jgi:hypothetical protein